MQGYTLSSRHSILRYLQYYSLSITDFVTYPISRAMYAEIHDVLIIGSGPAGLAVAARLRESTPSALFTDAEHNRYQWIKKHSGRMSLHSRNIGTAFTPKSPPKACCTSDRY